MKRIIFALLLVWSTSALAQEKATALRCNATAIGNIAQNGNTIAITSPTLGAIFLCGYNLSSGGTAVTATIGYGTGTQGTFTSLTLGWTLSPTIASPNPIVMDTSSAYRGLYVPPGNAVLINESTTATLGYMIHYFQENTNR